MNVVSKDVLLILERVKLGEQLTSIPERWWDFFNPYVVRFQGDKKPLAPDTCDYLKRRRFLRTQKTVAGVRFLELTRAGEKVLSQNLSI